MFCILCNIPPTDCLDMMLFFIKHWFFLYFTSNSFWIYNLASFYEYTAEGLNILSKISFQFILNYLKKR